MRDAIQAGGDTDTLGSITGQVAGAWAGLGRMPQQLLQQVPEGEAILQTARLFASRVAAGALP